MICSGVYQGRLAAIAARAPLVTDLRLDARQAGETGHPVRATGLALIEQVVVQLAVAIDHATVVPGLPDQVGLPGVFLRSVAQRVL